MSDVLRWTTPHQVRLQSYSGTLDPLSDEAIERAAACLLGELTVSGTLPVNRSASYHKDDLRLAATRIVAAAVDPMWGRR